MAKRKNSSLAKAEAALSRALRGVEKAVAGLTGTKNSKKTRRKQSGRKKPKR